MHKPTAVSIGTFDGFHRGHKYLIDRLISVSRQEKLKSVVIALSRPVRSVSGLLTIAAQKKELISKCCVDEVILLEIDSKIINLSSTGFIKEFLKNKFNMRYLVVGTNFALGHAREGNVDWLKKNLPAINSKLVVVKPLKYRSVVISSSRIRTLIHNNRVSYAAKLLGRPYIISGVSYSDRGVGTKIGCPTVNIKISVNIIVPKGIFTGFVQIGSDSVLHRALISVGYRSTLLFNGSLSLEAHILSFHKNIKNKYVKVHFCSHLRSEKKFKNVLELQSAIAADIERSKSFLQKDMKLFTL